jgi:holliday junction DNA helicase RuvA
MVLINKRTHLNFCRKGIRMITWLNGTIKSVYEHIVTIECHGIGFGVYVARPETFQKEQSLSLHIYFNWNQDQGPSLFGFLTPQERALFIAITSCPGIGPKIALSILAETTIGNFVTAIHTNNISALTTLNGIGKKKAEQIILHLRDKLDLFIADKEVMENNTVLQQWQELADVLTSLNYSRQEINNALSSLKAQSHQESFDQLLRKALSLLTKKR